MGDLANGNDCDAFITAFSKEVIQKYRSPLLDLTFGDRALYHLGIDDNWEVRLYAVVKTGMKTSDGDEVVEQFRVEASPDFFPPSDSFASEVAQHLGLTEEEVERRLEKGAEDAEEAYQKKRAAWEQEDALSQASA